MHDVQKVGDAPEGLREAKKRATRQQLTSAARQLTLAHGLDSVTVEMICGEVGVSVRTFFNYFATKDEALVPDDLPIGDENLRRRFVEGGPSGDLMADLLTVIDPSDGIRDAGRAELRRGMAVLMQEPRILAQELARGMERERRLAELVALRAGLADPDASCTTVAAVAQTLLRRAVTEWVEADDESEIGSHLRRCLVTVTRALPS